MSEHAHEPSLPRRSHSPSMDEPYLEFDLTLAADELRREPEWQRGHNARTLAKYDSLRVVLSTLKADARIPEHQTEGRISIQTIRGHIRVRADGRTFELRTGGLLTLDQGLRHDVLALEDSVFLLTIAWPGRGEPGAG